MGDEGGAGEPTVEVHGLAKSFGNARILRGVNLSVCRGEVVVVMGPSGSGKTTFLRCLNFLEMPDSGDITVAGTQVRVTSAALTRSMRRQIHDIRLKTAMVFQSFNLFTHMTVLENLIEGPVHVKGIAKAEAVARAHELLSQVGLSEKADAYPGRLSGGQKQRVAIARALAMSPQVLLFDEPTSALDPELRDEVLTVMRQLAGTGITMLVVTHEVRFARDAADRVVFMEGGSVLADLPSHAFFDAPANERVRQFLRRVE